MSLNKFRYDTEDVEKFAMANCMMILDRARVTDSGRIFKCKTCNRTFASFQALGGHTASHKRPKFVDGESGLVRVSKTHQCSICKHEFYTGQALGGHMRRHRGENKVESMETAASNCLSTSTDHESERGVAELKRRIIEKRILSSSELEGEPEVKRTIIEKRILSSSELEGEPEVKRTVIEKRILSSSELEGEPEVKRRIIEKRILSSSDESEREEPDLKRRMRLFGVDMSLVSPQVENLDVDTKTKMFFV